jgi:PAS domain S-box-containing protein
MPFNPMNPSAALPGLAFIGRVLDALPDPVFVKDRNHRFVMVNEALCRFTGVERSRLLGRTDHDFFPEHEAAEYVRRDEEVFTTGRDNLNEETLTDPAGRTHTISTKKTLYVDSTGHPYIIGVIRDITEVVAARREREKLVAELQAALAEVRSLQEILPICSYCHRIRDDQNYWSRLEIYLREHAGVEVSHGICPACVEEHVQPMLDELRSTKDPEPGDS